jgi:hypothetical protein
MPRNEKIERIISYLQETRDSYSKIEKRFEESREFDKASLAAHSVTILQRCLDRVKVIAEASS